ncbi:MAG: hypothetical protein KDC44_04375 [Phaeodactylibacter sp.]|nr:hypothetical protein [Phaeodactylibacter sp.]
MLTNAFKYAFRETENGKLTVETREVDDRLLLYIQDNGPGLPEDFDPMQSEQFGMELVRSLATKLKAELKLKNEGGLGFSLLISNYKKV